MILIGPMNHRGFTLLEVMISMVILGMALIVLLNMGMVALDGNDWSNKTTSSTQVTQQKLEHLRANINGAVAGSDTIRGMERSWDIRHAGKFLREVVVATRWEDVRGIIHNDSMTAYVRTDSI
ncbi:MAG: prepilin-type N-terminal cleavage/methylation domain-containing protein [bacterium]|nr:prepilin-type N-terminal cleavage/methylation domain-containing protein [bacterium]